MRSWSLPCLAALCLAVVPGVCQQMKTILDLDFSKVPAEWRLPIQDGALHVQNGLTLLPVTNLTDAVIQYRVKVRGEGLVELLFRHDLDTDNYYIFRIDTRRDGGDPPGFLKRNRKGAPWVLVGKRTGVAPKPDTWVKVRLEMHGDSFRGYVDGKLVATLKDGDFRQGGLGFRSQLTEGWVDDLKITVPPGARYTMLKVRPPQIQKPAPYTQDKWWAKWIWSSAADNQLTRVFRKHFDMPDLAREATVAVTCDNSYDLYLNGHHLGGDEDWQSLETYDVARLLHKGDNVFAALCKNSEPGAAGLLLEFGATTMSGKYVHVISDASWKVSLTVPKGWQEPGFDDHAWPTAQSEGRQPQQPWAGQSDLRLPYLGPKQPVDLVSMSAPKTIAVGQDLRLRATWKPLQKLTADYPLVVRIKQSAGWSDIATVQPKTPTRKWPVGKPHTETLDLPLRPDVGYLLTPGAVSLGLDLRGTICMNRTGGAVATAKFDRVAPKVGHAKPTLAREAHQGTFTDPAGLQHRWSLDAQGHVVVDGVPMIPIEYSGVYWCDAASAGKALSALDWHSFVRRICAQGGPSGADFVRVKLVDHIDATRTDHDFSDDSGLGGHSRILHIGDRDYRVTSSRDRISYFAYTATCEHPRNPHVMMFQSVNDRERYTTLRIQPPWDNVGGGVYTGREYPCDDKPIEHLFIFYPRDKKIRFTISRMPVEKTITPESGAAVSHIWLFEIEDPLASKPVTVQAPPGKERRLGMYLTHPVYFWTLYGYRGDTPEKRQASLRSFFDYMKFCGLNLLEFNAVDGGDTTHTAFYKSKIWERAPGDLLADLMPLCEKNNIQLIPIITSLSVPEGKWGFTRDSFQMDRYGHLTRFFASRPPLPDPLRPEVQSLLLRNLDEILKECAHSKAVPAIGFRVNGKIGLCYGGDVLGKSDQYTGYSAWDVAQFSHDTGIAVPAMKPTSYEWIKAHCWQKWLDWRCSRTRDFWLRCRDEVRKYRPDLVLYISCDMPSETPAWNIYWPSGISPLDCWRFHGVDPRMFADQPGILLQRGMMISADRYFTRAGQYGRNVEDLKAFHYAPGVTELYKGREGAACELYHDYWEEHGIIPMGEFGTDFWGAATMYPYGRNYFEPIAFSVGKTNCHTLNLFSWERGTYGHEHDLRAFARAFRALPWGAGEDATALVSGDTKGLWVRRFGNRLAVLNMTGKPRVVEVRYPARVGAQGVLEYGRYQYLPASASGEVTLPLEAYELRVLGP